MFAWIHWLGPADVYFGAISMSYEVNGSSPSMKALFALMYLFRTLTYSDVFRGGDIKGPHACFLRALYRTAIGHASARRPCDSRILHRTVEALAELLKVISPIISITQKIHHHTCGELGNHTHTKKQALSSCNSILNYIRMGQSPISFKTLPVI